MPRVCAKWALVRGKSTWPRPVFCFALPLAAAGTVPGSAESDEIKWLSRTARPTSALRTIWGKGNYYNARSMDVFMSHLRRRLWQVAGVALLTIRGIGCKLIC